MIDKQYDRTIQELKYCYNTHAKKFSNTRKKHRSELGRIVEAIQQQHYQNTIALELGCGDGRLYPLLKESLDIKGYTGVDISGELLQIAKKTHPDTENVQRVENDMLTYLQQQESESVDVIICVASFQHLPNTNIRKKVLQEAYRVLKYTGSLISIDWSWSRWMIKKQRKSILQSCWKSFYTLNQQERNNLSITFQHKGKIASRLYHIFTRRELNSLLQTQGFCVEKMVYSSQSGIFHENRKQARNICTLANKKINIKQK